MSTHEDGVAAAQRLHSNAAEVIAAYLAKRSECKTCGGDGWVTGAVRVPGDGDRAPCPTCTNRRLLLDLGTYEVVVAEQVTHGHIASNGVLMGCPFITCKIEEPGTPLYRHTTRSGE